MGFRFLMVISEPGCHCPRDIERAALKHRLCKLHSDPEVELFTSETDCWAKLPNSRGIVIGQIFERHSGENFTTSKGKILENARDIDEVLRSYWGGYIALCVRSGRREVMRDPSGMLPCYYVEREGAWFFASDAPLFIETGISSPSIDWDGLAHALYANDLPEERTAVTGVKQLLPGAALKIANGRAQTRACWTPWDHVTPRARDAHKVRSTVLDCIHQWGSQFDSILVGVSGGLDSSIVANGLVGAGPLQGLTISTQDPFGDESAYAHVLCQALDIPLFEKTYLIEAVDIRRSSMIHCPRPGGRAQLQAYDAALIEVAEQCGSTAFFTGVGGDNVFHYSKSARPLVDRFLAQGLSRDLWSTLMDITRLTGASVWTAIREATRVPRASGIKYRWRADRRFLTADVVDALDSETLSHPWLEGPPDCLPGKAAHVAMLVRSHQYLESHDRRLSFATVHPLLSQPIIEECLSVPSWTSCEGGIDRAYARRAFAEDLPAEVLARRTKGGPDGFALEVIRTHLGSIRERLLDGMLATQRIVDRKALDLALAEQALSRGEDYVRILLLLDAEAWTHAWSSGDVRQIFH